MPHAWLIHVLEVSGFDIGIVRFFAKLHEGGKGTISFAGHQRPVIAMGCGVRQGCPAPMALFCHAIDPS